MKAQLLTFWKAILLNLTVLGFLSACAPGLGSVLSMPTVQPEAQPAIQSGVSIRLRPFVDVRPAPTLVHIDDRNIRADRDVGELVEAAFRNYARQSGILLDSDRGAIVSMRIEEWRADVRPSFPASTIDARIRLELAVWNQRGELSFRSSYEGTTQYQHPLVGEEKIAWALNDCLGYALREAFADDRLFSKLRALSAEH
ncbi:MAG: YajG family lipoprotein [Oligoflexia bacterium]|nr:YajG family lipoprotein [Oligoflexia bacterium]